MDLIYFICILKHIICSTEVVRTEALCTEYTYTSFFQNFCFVLRIVCFVSLCVLFLCKCVLYCCHQVATQLQLTNISFFRTIILTVILYGCGTWSLTLKVFENREERGKKEVEKTT
jgi:hypothetical protein